MSRQIKPDFRIIKQKYVPLTEKASEKPVLKSA